MNTSPVRPGRLVDHWLIYFSLIKTHVTYCNNTTETVCKPVLKFELRTYQPLVLRSNHITSYTSYISRPLVDLFQCRCSLKIPYCSLMLYGENRKTPDKPEMGNIQLINVYVSYGCLRLVMVCSLTRKNACKQLFPWRELFFSKYL